MAQSRAFGAPGKSPPARTNYPPRAKLPQSCGGLQTLGQLHSFALGSAPLPKTHLGRLPTAWSAQTLTVHDHPDRLASTDPALASRRHRKISFAPGRTPPRSVRLLHAVPTPPPGPLPADIVPACSACPIDRRIGAKSRSGTVEYLCYFMISSRIFYKPTQK